MKGRQTLLTEGCQEALATVPVMGKALCSAYPSPRENAAKT